MKQKRNGNVNILGTEYSFQYTTADKDPELKNLSGYCITSQKKIAVEAKKGEPYIEQWTLRHEIIHAFLHESGLDKEAPWGDQEELFVDWIALQLPKIVKVCQEIGAL